MNRVTELAHLIGERLSEQQLEQLAEEYGIRLPRQFKPGDMFVHNRLDSSILVLGHNTRGRKNRGHTFIHLRHFRDGFNGGADDLTLRHRPCELRDYDQNATPAERFINEAPTHNCGDYWRYAGNLSDWIDNDILRESADEIEAEK